VQTLADLGLVGMAVSIALAGAWLWSALRVTRPGGIVRVGGARFERRPVPFTAERVGLLTMLAIVLAFTVHSLIDWTWFVPGDVCVALLCAGWLAGGGDEASAGGRRLWPAIRDSAPLRRAGAALALAAALLAAWTQWQPLRSSNATSAASIAYAQGQTAQALADVHAARSRDPLAVAPLYVLGAIEQGAGHPAAARAALVEAVRLQPSNPQTWRALAEFDLGPGGRGALASLAELRPALFLDPQSQSSIDDFVTVYRTLHPAQFVTPAPAIAPSAAARQAAPSPSG